MHNDDAQHGQSALDAFNGEGLSVIMNANPVPCFVIDSDHRIIHWNHGCEQILGIPASEMLGTKNQWWPFYDQPRSTLADLIADNRMGTVAPELYARKRLRPSTIVDGAYEAIDFFPKLGKSGRWLFFTAAPIRDAEGNTIGAVETLQDITAQREAEIALQASHDELERKVAERTAELAQSLEKAKLADRLKTAFLATVSDELKNPLNAIIGFSDLIAMEHPDDSDGEYARQINESGKRLYDLVSAMLTLSELEAGNSEQVCHPFDLKELLEGLHNEYRPIAERRNTQLSFEFTGDHDRAVNSDPVRLRKSVGALIDNAVRYMDHEGGSVRVLAERDDKEIRITVCDDGPGIGAGQEDKIFEKFRHGETFSTRRSGGIGLGLALARAQSDFLGGSLKLQPTPGSKGACFVLTLPTSR